MQLTGKKFPVVYSSTNVKFCKDTSKKGLISCLRRSQQLITENNHFYAQFCEHLDHLYTCVNIEKCFMWIEASSKNIKQSTKTSMIESEHIVKKKHEFDTEIIEFYFFNFSDCQVLDARMNNCLSLDA